MRNKWRLLHVIEGWGFNLSTVVLNKYQVRYLEVP
jgi:hypothetical protein